MSKQQHKNEWDIDQSKSLYNLTYWGEGYFDINQKGELVVNNTDGLNNISLYQLAQELQNQGIDLPVLVRFPHILLDRIQRLYQAFSTAMQQYDYPARYTAVYPIKVNQQEAVLQTIQKSGKMGLEAGSKAELVAVLALSAKEGVVICNGYKDREYIRLALIGQKMGIQTYIVIEKLSELPLIVEESQRLNIQPKLGIRVKLASIAKGKWQDSGGEKSKFGLNANQILEITEDLRKFGLTDCVQLMHFHVGSQIPNIQDIQKSLTEAVRFYAELHALGLPIRCVDVGGGLGIDYEGTHSRSACSMNYDIQEYANNVIYQFNETCQTMNLPKPDIITETGRAITAHHAVLITNIIDNETVSEQIYEPSTDDTEIIQDLQQQFDSIDQRSALEAYHNASYWINEIHSLFSYGVIDLKQRAHAEQLYSLICERAHGVLVKQPNFRLNHEIFDELNEKMADKYFVNFSLFQSVPDAWAIDQLFPIMPLHRLGEQPKQRATLQDLTCDSDGQFDHYTNDSEIDNSLPIHILTKNEPYLLGIFLLGAYQEVLGGKHNLFGQINAVNVSFSFTGNCQISNIVKGENISDVLESVGIDKSILLDNYIDKLENTTLSAQKKHEYFDEIRLSLDKYTYLNS